MSEYIVVMPRIEGNPETGYSTCYYTDRVRCFSLRDVKRHGMDDLDQSDDFLIGTLDGCRLLSLQWMDDLRDDHDELLDVANQLGLTA